LVTFDVSPLTPTAQPIVLQAAEIYYRHLSPWLIGLLIHGSAYKGGFIPGCSDIDLKLYLRQEAFVSGDNLPLDLAISLHRDLARLDPAPFQYIQTQAVFPQPHGEHENAQLGPVSGAYHMLWGDLPVPEATREQAIQSAHRTLKRIPSVIDSIGNELLQHGGGKLERRVRFLCTDVWPTLYSLRVLQSDDPLDVWRKPKTVILESLPSYEPIGQAIRNFYQGLCTYYAGESSVENALRAITHGIHFLSLAMQWYQAR
jgi:hypothetical protein